MRVRFNLCWASPAGTARPGDVMDLPKQQAEALIAARAAEAVAADDFAPPRPESQSVPASLPDPATPSAAEGLPTKPSTAVKPAAPAAPRVNPTPILPKRT